ncbi:MAG: hypothetical protein IT445_19250 [Phycisphaeraceae bacterium]|nr:hypothetical protein [Phycisphaeraceae bacterium]
MKIYTISTLHDWTHFTGAAGPTGIERIFDWMTIARIERVYWRVFEGGLATYPSKLATVFRGSQVKSWRGLGDGGGPKSEQWATREDCSRWDPLALAVEIAHRRGIELCAWWTLCEEDHGGHVGSDFGQQKQFRLQTRDGKDYPGTVELFLPQVQRYRLAILKEILERNVDGVLLDFARNNATPSAASDGYHHFGFNAPVRKAFYKHHGVDPIDLPSDDQRWVAFKNAYRAEFIRQIRRRVGKNRHLDLMTIPHVNNYRWLCLDLPALSRDGTLDLVMPFNMTYCNSPRATAEQVRQLRSQIKGRHTKIAAGIQAYWGMTPDAYEGALDAAHTAGARTTVLYEADMLPRMNLLTPTRAHHLRASRGSRGLVVKMCRSKPSTTHWRHVDHHRGLYIVAGPDQVKASAATSFQIVAGPDSLHVRVHCMGRQAEVPSEMLQEKAAYLKWIGGRNFWQRSDKVHVLLDPGPTRSDYQHYSGDRHGNAWTEKRFLNPWSTTWTYRAVRESANRWVAEFEIPYRIIGDRPGKDAQWGFQLVREQCATREVASWFISTAYGVDPQEWGDMRFV